MKHAFFSLLMSTLISSSVTAGGTSMGKFLPNSPAEFSFVEYFLFREWRAGIQPKAEVPLQPPRKTPQRLVWEQEEKKYWDEWERNIRERARQKWGPLYKEREREAS